VQAEPHRRMEDTYQGDKVTKDGFGRKPTVKDKDMPRRIQTMISDLWNVVGNISRECIHWGAQELEERGSQMTFDYEDGTKIKALCS